MQSDWCCLAEHGRKEGQYRKPLQYYGLIAGCGLVAGLLRTDGGKSEGRLWMRFFHSIFSTRIAGAIFALLFAAASAGAQSTAANPSQAPAAGSREADNEWLAKTAKMYFSSARAGLAGFNCDIRPDWNGLFASANKGAGSLASNPTLAALKKVKVKMHARLRGGSTIEWEAEADDGAPASDATNAAVEAMHQTVQQILEGFLQFWGPFMEVTVVPAKADGLEITHSATQHTIHAKQGTTELTEIFNSNLALEHFDVMLAGASIKLSPTFEPTPQGLLVKSFAAEIMPAGATAGQTQKMQAQVDYQTVNGQTIPGQLNMSVAGMGNFNFAFDGCSTEGK